MMLIKVSLENIKSTPKIAIKAIWKNDNSISVGVKNSTPENTIKSIPKIVLNLLPKILSFIGCRCYALTLDGVNG